MTEQLDSTELARVAFAKLKREVGQTDAETIAKGLLSQNIRPELLLKYRLAVKNFLRANPLAPAGATFETLLADAEKKHGPVVSNAVETATIAPPEEKPAEQRPSQELEAALDKNTLARLEKTAWGVYHTLTSKGKKNLITILNQEREAHQFLSQEDLEKLQTHKTAINKFLAILKNKHRWPVAVDWDALYLHALLDNEMIPYRAAHELAKQKKQELRKQLGTPQLDLLLILAEGVNRFRGRTPTPEELLKTDRKSIMFPTKIEVGRWSKHQALINEFFKLEFKTDEITYARLLELAPTKEQLQAQHPALATKLSTPAPRRTNPVAPPEPRPEPPTAPESTATPAITPEAPAPTATAAPAASEAATAAPGLEADAKEVQERNLVELWGNAWRELQAKTNLEFALLLRSGGGLYRYFSERTLGNDHAIALAEAKKYAFSRADKDRPTRAVILAHQEAVEALRLTAPFLDRLRFEDILDLALDTGKPAPQPPGPPPREAAVALPLPNTKETVPPDTGPEWPVPITELGDDDALAVKRAFVSYEDTLGPGYYSDDKLRQFIIKDANSKKILATLKYLVENDRQSFDQVCEGILKKFLASAESKQLTLNDWDKSISWVRWVVSHLVYKQMQSVPAEQRTAGQIHLLLLSVNQEQTANQSLAAIMKARSAKLKPPAVAAPELAPIKPPAPTTESTPTPAETAPLPAAVAELKPPPQTLEAWPDENALWTFLLDAYRKYNWRPQEFIAVILTAAAQGQKIITAETVLKTPGAKDYINRILADAAPDFLRSLPTGAQHDMVHSLTTDPRMGKINPPDLRFIIEQIIPRLADPNTNSAELLLQNLSAAKKELSPRFFKVINWLLDKKRL